MSAAASFLVPGPWQGGFVSILPTIHRQVRHSFRRQQAVHQEESVAEGIAAACVSYQLLAARGQLHRVSPTSIAGYALRHVRSGRHVGGSQDSVQDPLGPAARRRGVLVHSLQAGGGEGTEWRGLALADKRSDVAELACFRLDFQDWLSTLTERDRRVISGLCEGEPAKALAERLGLTPGRISQLRRLYERLWKQFQGDAVATAA
jgi:hypothetical protein